MMELVFYVSITVFVSLFAALSVIQISLPIKDDTSGLIEQHKWTKLPLIALFVSGFVAIVAGIVSRLI